MSISLRGFIAIAFAALSPPASAQMTGDSAAVAAIERMMEAVGGKPLWANARTLHLEYRARILSPRALNDTEVAWRDLTAPYERIEHRIEDGTGRVSVFTPAGGWRIRDGVFRAMTDAEYVGARTFWPKDFYTLFRRFAINDPDLVLRWFPPRVGVVSRTQGELGWFEIASDGGIVRWGTLDDAVMLEYVYGPMRSFGAVRYPAWGARLDGGWRWEYTRVELSRAAIPDSLLIPPRR